MRLLHELLREYSTDEKQYKEYIQSLKNSVLTAFYTPEAVASVIQRTLQASGVVPGRFLDPSAGTGVFISPLKDVPEITCFEKDKLTGRILSALYPDSKVIIDGFQTIQPYYNGYFDVVSSNIPFGDTRVYDRDFDRSGDPVRKGALNAVHNYFFLKGMDTLREGGIMAFITTSGVMDSPGNRPIREWLMNHAGLVSAVRLPGNLFTDAGTKVSSDLIVLQKNSRKNGLTEAERNFIKTRTLPGNITINNSYKELDHIIHTAVKTGKNMYGQPAMNFIHDGSVETISEELGGLLLRDIENRLNRELYTENLSRQSVPSTAIQPTITITEEDERPQKASRWNSSLPPDRMNPCSTFSTLMPKKRRKYRKTECRKEKL